MMAASLDDARGLVELTAAHEALLLDVARPIVLAPARRRSGRRGAGQRVAGRDAALCAAA